MPSGPAAFLVFTLIRALLTLCSVTECVLFPSNGTHSSYGPANCVVASLERINSDRLLGMGQHSQLRGICPSSPCHRRLGSHCFVPPLCVLHHSLESVRRHFVFVHVAGHEAAVEEAAVEEFRVSDGSIDPLAPSMASSSFAMKLIKLRP